MEALYIMYKIVGENESGDILVERRPHRVSEGFCLKFRIAQGKLPFAVNKTSGDGGGPGCFIHFNESCYYLLPLASDPEKQPDRSIRGDFDDKILKKALAPRAVNSFIEVNRESAAREAMRHLTCDYPCRNLQEEIVCIMLAEGSSLASAREASGLSCEEFGSLTERLKRYEAWRLHGRFL